MFDYEDELDLYKGHDITIVEKDIMQNVDIGDIISFGVKNKEITINYQDYNEIFNGLIIGKKTIYEDVYEYIVYIPEYQRYFLNDSILIRHDHIKKYSIQTKFLNEYGAFIRKGNILNIIEKLDGATCNRCKEFNSKSEPNQEDGTFLCYQCRKDRFR